MRVTFDRVGKAEVTEHCALDVDAADLREQTLSEVIGHAGNVEVVDVEVGEWDDVEQPELVEDSITED